MRKSPHSKLTLEQKHEKAQALVNKLYDLVIWEDDLNENIKNRKAQGEHDDDTTNEGWRELQDAIRKIQDWRSYPTWY
jgi:hypothetical protein